MHGMHSMRARPRTLEHHSALLYSVAFEYAINLSANAVRESYSSRHVKFRFRFLRNSCQHEDAACWMLCRFLHASQQNQSPASFVRTYLYRANWLEGFSQSMKSVHYVSLRTPLASLPEPWHPSY